MNVRPSSLVTVFVPQTQYPPTQMTLMQVRVGLLQGGIPPTAVVQVVPNGEWLPAWQVVGDCVDFKPTRAGGAMALLFVVPLVLLIVHRAIFAGAGGLWTIALLVAGIAGQAFIGMTPRLRTQSTGELLSKRTFQLVVGGTLLVCLVPGTALGVIDRSKHARVQAALASANPCDVETVTDVLLNEGTDEEKSAASSKESACQDARYKQACDQVVSHLDGNAVTAEDLASLKAHGEPKDADVVARLSKHALTDSDLSLAQSDLGCSGRIWDRVVGALAASSSVWSTATSLSDDMAKALSDAGLSADAKAALKAHAETVAASVANKNKTDDMALGETLCKLCADPSGAIGPACTALNTRYARLEARELAKDAQEQAIDDAARKRSGAGFVSCMAQCNRSRAPTDREAESACVEGCAGDLTCSSKCHHASDCEAGCLQQYPSAANGY